MLRIKPVKMKPRVKNGATSTIHHRFLSWIPDMATLSHPFLTPVSSQLDRSPAMLPMTTSILGMACDEAPVTRWTRETHETGRQLPPYGQHHLQGVPAKPGQDVNSLPMAISTFKEFQSKQGWRDAAASASFAPVVLRMRSCCSCRVISQ